MVYPGDFVRLVIIGNQFDDVFNTTLSFVPSVPGVLGVSVVTPTLLSGVASTIATWWNGAIVGDHPNFLFQDVLTGIKLNVIDETGHYRDPETMEHVYTTPVHGATTSSNVKPPQETIVHTIETGIPRGLASRGRMYLPPQLWAPVAADGRISVSNATNSAAALGKLITSLNALFDTDATGDETQLRAGVASNTRSGAFRVATSVSVGRVIDTMRSRRNKFQEDRQDVAIA